MKLRITKAVAIIAAVFVGIGLILCIAGKFANGSLIRAFENMGGRVQYYDNRDMQNDRYNQNVDEFYDDFYDDFFNSDLEEFFGEFENMYGGDNNEASL